MNKKITLFIGFLLVAVLVKGDKHNRNQWASMEYKQWKFTPDDYYYSWYYRTINLGLFEIKIKLPGKGIHDRGFAGCGFPGDNYVNQRWRQMSGLRMEAVGMVKLEKEETERIKSRWNEIMQRDALELTDKTVDTGKLVEDSRRGKLSAQITQTASKLPKEESQNIMDEYERIRENFQIIHKAFIPNADKIVAYRKQLNKLERLNKITRAIYLMKQSEKAIHPGNLTQPDDDWFDLD